MYSRSQNTTLDTITQFVFFVIKEVSLDIDCRVTIQFPAIHRSILCAKGVCGRCSYVSVLRGFAPTGSWEKPDIPSALRKEFIKKVCAGVVSHAPLAADRFGRISPVLTRVFARWRIGGIRQRQSFEWSHTVKRAGGKQASGGQYAGSSRRTVRAV